MALYCLALYWSEKIVKSSKHPKNTFCCWFSVSVENHRDELFRNHDFHENFTRKISTFPTHTAALWAYRWECFCLKITPMSQWDDEVLCRKSGAEGNAWWVFHLRNVRLMTNYFMFCISSGIFYFKEDC